MSDSRNTDERFEEFLEKEAHAYNVPPNDVPRDAMWGAIQAARAGARPAVVHEPTRPVPTAARRNRVTRIGIGIAASLIIGVAIGMFALAPREVASGDTPQPGATDTMSNTGYQVVASEHLARAEALLTAFGSSASDAVSDAQLSSWARDVLSNTRLLLDSPAARDPSRRRLLEDLERVLVEIVQHSPAAGAAEERSHIERTLQRTQVLPRLRSAQPTGVNSGT